MNATFFPKILCFRQHLPVARMLPLLVLTGSGLAFSDTERHLGGEVSSLAILAVGDPPVTRLVSAGFDAEGNALTQEADVDPARLPPAVVYHGPESAEKTGNRQVALFLNEFSTPLRFRPRDGLHVYLDLEEASDLIRLAGSRETRDHLLVLFPDPQSRSWDQLHKLTLPNDWTHFPANSIRIINVCNFDALFEDGNNQWLIGPGQTELIRISGDERSLPYRLFVRAGQNVEMLRRAALQINGGRRQTLVIHPTDPDFSRRSAGIAHFVETRQQDVASNE